jgi:hypothetical protein
MNAKFETTIIRDGQPVAVTVKYDFHVGHMGARDRRGYQIEDDGPCSADIVDVKDASGEDVDLTNAEYRQIERDIVESVNFCHPSAD